MPSVARHQGAVSRRGRGRFVGAGRQHGGTGQACLVGCIAAALERFAECPPRVVCRQAFGAQLRFDERQGVLQGLRRFSGVAEQRFGLGLPELLLGDAQHAAHQRGGAP